MDEGETENSPRGAKGTRRWGGALLLHSRKRLLPRFNMEMHLEGISYQA
jgi:hypothetical protein